MRSKLLAVLLVISAGCAPWPKEGGSVTPASEARFVLVSLDRLAENSGHVAVVKDTVTGQCMASHLFYYGVMSWRTVCDAAEMEQLIQQQMMQGFVAPSADLSRVGQ